MKHDPEIINAVQDFYRSWYEDEIAQFAQGYPRNGTTFTIDFSDVRQAVPDVAHDYEEQPQRVRNAFEVALEEFDLPAPIDLSDATIRFANLDGTLEHRLRDVGQWSPKEIANELSVVRGQVAKRSQGKILIEEAHWECQRCGTPHQIPQTASGDGLQEPHECQGCERQGPFTLNESKSIEDGTNFQVLRLQKPPDSDGEGQETLDVQLKGDLVDTVRPGDRVAMGTVIRGRTADGGEAPTMELYGEAEAIEQLESDFSDIDVDEHEERIREIAASDDPYQMIVDSILPSHRGDEELKTAIGLQLFGGVEKELPDGNHERGTIHIFAVGDPGVGKSTLLRYVQRLAPRSVFTTGTGSTAAGLTAAAMKDDFGDGGWTLEAGALVEANNGVACIDELDDMTEEDRAGLLEAMSDQRISISKAGINAELPARTRVLAAANPDLGRFDQFQPIPEQIDVHPALLSRFDLIFTMTDKPDVDEDLKTAEHINRGTRAGQRRARDEPSEDDEEIEPAIEPEVLRAYVALAREKNPVQTDAAAEKVRNEYARARQMNEDDDAIPTTPRMVGALNRLAEASARIRLGEYVTADDVERAVEIYRASMEDVGRDPDTGDIDADIIETGTSDSQRTRINRIQTLISSLSEEYEQGAPIEALVDHSQLSEWDESTIEHEIEELKQKGELYEPNPGFLRNT